MSSKIESNDPEGSSKLLHHLATKNKWIAILGAFLIVFIISSVVLLFFALRKNDDDVCLTKGCILTASTLIDAMDTNVDPCQNFQKFACANFVRKNPVDEDKMSTSTDQLFDTYFHIQMKDAIESLNPHGQPDVIVRMQKDYHVCINSTHQPEKEYEAFKNYTEEFLHWPLANGQDWKPSFSNLTGLFEYMHHTFEFQYPLFFIDFYNQEMDSGNLEAVILALNLSVFVNNDLIRGNDEKMQIIKHEAELELLRELLRLFGKTDSESIDQDIKDMEEVAKYEKQWKPSLNETLPNRVSIDELNELTDYKINWLAVLNLVRRKDNSTLLPNITVNIFNPETMARTLQICKKFPLRVIYNIIIWKIIFPYCVRQSGPKGLKLMQKYIEAFPESEQRKQKKIWVECLEYLKRFYPMPLTRLFVNKYINRSDKISANEMIKWLGKAYKAEITQSTWVDEETKKNAIKKADSIKRFVGYPDYIFDDEALNTEYDHIAPIQSIHFLNFLTYKDRARDASSKTKKWYSFSLELDAYFSPTDNSIWIPTGILQLPFFDDNRLAAVNFGLIGAIMGHEIGHAFDNSESNYDENGDLRNWWTNKTRALFTEKSKCFVEQYNKYCPEERQGDENDTFCVNGQQTLGENLADYTGVLASFSAYKMWVKEHGREKRLPGLQEYSPEQIFFISYAYRWCQNVPPDKLVSMYELDSHSPHYYRIIGPLSNSKDFRETFNCPEGPMNRGKDSCTMW